MRLSTILSLGAAIMAVAVNAECCGCSGSRCADGSGCSDGFSCCAYGPCNIFCCNCDGGCRRASSGLLRSNYFELHSKEESPTCMPTIMAADANEDGKITFLEWVYASGDPVNTPFTVLSDRWLKYDVENKGYLTYQEAMKRKAH